MDFPLPSSHNHFAGVILVRFLPFLSTCINIFHIIIICLYIVFIYSFFHSTFCYEKFQTYSKDEKILQETPCHHLDLGIIISSHHGYLSRAQNMIVLLSTGMQGWVKKRVPALDNQSIQWGDRQTDSLRYFAKVE